METLTLAALVLLVLCLVAAVVVSSMEIMKLSSTSNIGSSSSKKPMIKSMTASHSATQMPSSSSSSTTGIPLPSSSSSSSSSSPWGRGSHGIASIGLTPPATATDRTALIRDSSSSSSSSSSSRDNGSEFGSSGSLVRKYFFVSIAVANSARLISIVVYISAISTEQLVSCSRHCLAFVFICRVIPTSLYLTMYSLLTVFLAQLHHTVSGLPFSRVRILWFFVYLVFFCSSLFILCCIGLYSYSIYTQLQAPVLVKVSEKVLDRFVPVVVVCGFALLISSIYFLCMTTQLIAWPYGFPQSSLLLFDVASFGIMEIAPSLAIVYFLAYRKNTTVPSQEQSPYMSTGSTTQPVSTRQQRPTFQSTNVVSYKPLHPSE